jgi:putative transposase
MHADVNAARNIGQRRALSIGSVFQSKASVLAELVRQFSERRVRSTRSGGRGSTADPRLHNPYFGAEMRSAARMSGQTRVANLVFTTLT